MTNSSDFSVAFVVVRIGLSEVNVLVVDLDTHYLDVLVETFQFFCVCVYAVSHSCFKNCIQFSV